MGLPFYTLQYNNIFIYILLSLVFLITIIWMFLFLNLYTFLSIVSIIYLVSTVPISVISPWIRRLLRIYNYFKIILYIRILNKFSRPLLVNIVNTIVTSSLIIWKKSFISYFLIEKWGKIIFYAIAVLIFIEWII